MYEYKAETVRVIDGDTVVMRIDVGFDITVVKKIRLLGVNTPEIRGESREEGLKAKALVEAWLEGEEVVIFTSKADSFGRYLAEIVCNGESLTSYLLKMGYDPYRK
jgi:micrococcal nuclease